MTLIRMCDERFSSTNEALASRITRIEDKLTSGAFVRAVQEQSAKPAIENSTSEEKCTDASKSTETAANVSAVKKEYRQLPYFAEFVAKCSERDRMLGSLLRSSAKGYTVNTDELIHIRTGNKMALDIITKMFGEMLEVLNTFEEGRLSANSLKLEYVPEKVEDKNSELDELARLANEV